MLKKVLWLMICLVAAEVSAQSLLKIEKHTAKPIASAEYQQAVYIDNAVILLSKGGASVAALDAMAPAADASVVSEQQLAWMQLILQRYSAASFFTVEHDIVAAVSSAQQLSFLKFNPQSDDDIVVATPLRLPAQIAQVKVVAQHDGKAEHLYAFMFTKTQLAQIWKWDTRAEQWAQVLYSFSQSVPQGMFQSVIALNQSLIVALSDDGRFYLFNTITNEWVVDEAQMPVDTAVTVLAAAEVPNQFEVLQIHPGVLQQYNVTLRATKQDFGTVNMLVLVIYLLGVLLIGLVFSFKNRNTEDYFLGGKAIPWWAAACSIYATMLSSLTYVALPAIVYQTNWILLVGIWMLVVVAPIGIYIAMPFFRRLNIYSAYEYLSQRFSHAVRVLASVMFALFHIGRMGVVMALTALALSAVTPLSPAECVLIMGGLCLVYCTFGGIEAVIWTDTVQTVVLMLGAVLCFVIIILNIDGGMATFIQVGFDNDKFTLADTRFSLSGITELTLWVVVIGGIGQNLSSYIADQAVVQRYLVTPDEQSAARSIWANAVIGLPGALLFFLNGTGLYVYYKTQPEKLDLTIQIDQIFPSFISTELPVGIAGLIIAGVFAAAQSTVSTSMNSVATTLIVDVFKPANAIKSERTEIHWARAITFIVGAIGTAVGLIFIDPAIRSLMDEYFKIIGMFMGALGGLFILGAISTRANTLGAVMGLCSGVAVMLSAWKFGWANGYIYASLGITTCVVVGYITSLLSPKRSQVSEFTLFGNKFAKDKG